MLLRRAEPADALPVARVHVRSWQAAYRNLLPDAYLNGLRPEQRAERYTFGSADPQQPVTIVAVDDDTICGFCTLVPARDADSPGHGEIAALYVDPDWWGRGVGVALVTDARARLLDRGFRHAVLWVLAGNVRAQHFYVKDGWLPDGLRRTEKIWGVEVENVRYRRVLCTHPL